MAKAGSRFVLLYYFLLSALILSCQCQEGKVRRKLLWMYLQFNIYIYVVSCWVFGKPDFKWFIIQVHIVYLGDLPHGRGQASVVSGHYAILTNVLGRFCLSTN